MESRVLVIEGDPALRESLGRILKERGFRVQLAADGLQGLSAFRQEEPDLILFNLGLQNPSGFELCRRLREQSTVPLIFLTSANTESDRVTALNLGADDYVSLPYSVEELLATIQAVLRRSRWQGSPLRPARLRLGDLEIDLPARQLLQRGQKVELSRTEWAILEILVRHAGQVVPHRTLHQYVWGGVYTGDSANANLRNYIRYLRNKIEADPDHPVYLLTESGLGYYFAIHEWQSDSLAPPPSSSTLSTASTVALPSQATTFIGREAEILSVRQLLERPEVRLLTLTGPGGAGKTRLALQVAAGQREAFRHGVIFVSLAPISDPSLVGSVIAQTLGVREATGQPLNESLKNYLRDKQLLLLLDNFEQVVSAASLVVELLSSSIELKILVTSRAALRISGEYEFEVPPLAVPDLQRLPSLEVLRQSPAVALFVQRAQAVKPDFGLTDENATAIVELCARLDGLPLAIELAAARIKLLSPQAMIARLSSRLTFLTGGVRDLPARQQTLRHTLDWSYNLLETNEKTLFARLAVFAGGATLEAIEKVCVDQAQGARLKAQDFESLSLAPLGLEPSDVLLLLSSLLDKSMLRHAETEDGPRFVMLETIHEYAQERLEASDEADRLRRGHAIYYLEFVETAWPKLIGPESQVWMVRLDREYDNLRAALKWALEREAEVELALRLAIGLSWLCRLHGHLGDIRRLLDAALARSGALTEAARIPAVQEAIWLALSQGDFAQTRVFLEEITALRRALAEKQGGSAPPLVNILVLILEAQGDYARAQALEAEALILHRESGNKEQIAHSLNLLGVIALKQGDYERARTLQEESLALRRELGIRRDTAHSLLSLGHIARLQGDEAAAITLYEEALALSRAAEMNWGIAHALLNLGHIRCHQADYAQADALYRQALAYFHERGDKVGMAYVLEGLAGLVGVQRQSEAAARLWGAAEALRETIGAPLPPADRVDYDRSVATVRAQGNEADFIRAWEEGRSAPLEEILSVLQREA